MKKKILLQSGITLNTIWHKKEFWEKIIEYSINEEINYGKGFMIFLEEDSNSREKRVESAIMSTLITFLFNMKLFGCPENEIRIIIDEFIEKYKIDGTMVYATNVNMKEIKYDIIVESVENIIKNSKENENQNQLKRNNTNDSKNDKNNSKNPNNKIDKDYKINIEDNKNNKYNKDNKINIEDNKDNKDKNENF